MTEPEPATLESIARQIVEVHALLDGLRDGVRTLMEIATRTETTTNALLEEARAFNEARKRDRR